MKKVLALVMFTAMLAMLSGCGSLRTPNGDRAGKVFYNTFFGLSIESALYGDGIIPQP